MYFWNKQFNQIYHDDILSQVVFRVRIKYEVVRYLLQIILNKLNISIFGISNFQVTTFTITKLCNSYKLFIYEHGLPLAFTF